MKDSDSQSQVLLVEGQDDKHVVEHICFRKGLGKTFCVKDKNGYTELLRSIPTEVKAPGRRVVGIVLDADDDLNARWNAVRHWLRELGSEYFDQSDFPEEPVPTGTIIEGRRRIGIWLMPDNKSQGELEDFVENMIPSGDPVWPLSRRYIEGIPKGDRRFRCGKILKAKIHAWLATRKEPRKMGAAIGASDLTLDTTNTAAFVDWLRKLSER